ncbi:hypothetical protein CUMW_254090 [Citrus unshiu]|uniref:Malectin domain-containing protein n=1 Tax=Citrus unshiu TaxID=55188 RepID=A0A2H5QRA3_CITUN|nr:hypothetical protein CUMW_254090 [Citrus unshiu]
MLVAMNITSKEFGMRQINRHQIFLLTNRHTTGHIAATDISIRIQWLIRVTCGAAVIDAPLYDEARLCPNSLKYYGFCLQNGNYNVSLHFSEIVFAKNDDYSSSAKRVFDIYIQGELRRKDFNIKEMARHSNNVTIQNFTASVQKHLLEIELFWAGKGSILNPPYFHGPLISAISVAPSTISKSTDQEDYLK